MSFQDCKIIGTGVDSEQYHALSVARGDVAFPVSPSMLKEFARCPARWRKGYAPPDSDAKAFGRRLDCLLLTPELFSQRHAVRPEVYTNEDGEVKPWNLNAKVCKAWVAEHAQRDVISPREFGDCSDAVSALMADEILAAFLKCSDRQVWVAGLWRDEETGVQFPVRCLLDLVPRAESEFGRCLADFKTTRSASLVPFQRQVHQMGWHVQAAFDLDLFTSATREDRNTWCLLVQESFRPWQSARRILAHDFIELGRADYTRALKLYAQCLKHGRWPDYDEHDETAQGWSICAPSPWMESDGLFAPKMNAAPPVDHQHAPEMEEIVP